MAYPLGGTATPVKLRQRLEELGCAIIDLSGEIITPEGRCHVTYVVRHETGKYMTLPMLDEDELISPWVIGNIERRLGVHTGFTSI